MPKHDKKRSKRDSSDSSDSGPDDKTPVKKAKPAADSGAKPSGASGNALPGNEPSWLLSGMKFVKVTDCCGSVDT